MSEQEIERTIESYGWKPKIFSDTILITSKFDTWMIEMKHHAVVLKHQNLKRNPSQKFVGHTHKTFVGGTVNDALKEIQKHDDYIIKYKNNSYTRSSLFQKLQQMSTM